MSKQKDSVEAMFNRLKSKKEIHEMIDSMGDGDQAILMISVDDEEREVHKFHTYGEVTVERAYYMCGNYQNYLMGLMND